MMDNRKEVVITRIRERLFLFYLEDRKIFDVLAEEDARPDTVRVGDIYVGKVQNIIENIRAAFVEVQKNVLCYLPLSECGDREIKCGDELVVQVKKAAVKTKKAVVTCYPEMAGRFVVISTKNPEKSISKKITENGSREQLRKFLLEFEEEPYGIVLRTNARWAAPEEVRGECETLLCEMHQRMEQGQYRSCFSLLHREKSFYQKYLDSCRIMELNRIVTDQEEIYRELQPVYGDLVQRYQDESYSLDHLLGLSTNLKKALEKRVWLKSGANLVIEPTEALTVIDVNTGKAIEGKRNKETTFFKINCEAAKEVARQIRMRNMSGIILIDFIDMQKKAHREELMLLLQELLDRDLTRTALIDITKLGLVEVTRMKKNSPLWEIIK